MIDRFPRTAFILKGLFVAELFMFGSMAVGELFYDPLLFRGFLKRPEIWFGIIIETALATFLVSTIGVYILSKIELKDRRKFLFASIGIWVLLSVLVVVLYGVFYFPREWRLTSLGPGLIFGWIIPGVLIVACLSWFSQRLAR